MKTETTLMTLRPSMYRGNPVRFVAITAGIASGCSLMLAGDSIITDPTVPTAVPLLPGLLIAGVSVIALFRWWLQCLTTRLIVTDRRVFRHLGIVSRQTIQIRHSNIQNVYIHQGVFQRLMGCGVLGLSSSGETNVEIQVPGIPHPTRIADKIQDILDLTQAA